MEQGVAQGQNKSMYRIGNYSIFTGRGVVPTATVGLFHGDELYIESNWGDNPVDAVIRAISLITKTPIQVESLESKANQNGASSAPGIASLTGKYEGSRYRAMGTGVDPTDAAINAYLDVVNQVVGTSPKHQLEPSGILIP